MKRKLTLCFIMLISLNSMASNNISSAIAEFGWEKRQLIVFTPSVNHPQYKKFQDQVATLQVAYKERNLHSWHVVAEDKVFLEGITRSDLSNTKFRENFEVSNNDFRLILIGYDQGEKLRLDIANIKKIFATIDSMPMRIQEMQSN